MDATVDNKKIHLNWLTVLSSFAVCLLLFFLLMELIFRVSPPSASLHSITAPVDITSESIEEEVTEAEASDYSTPINQSLLLDMSASQEEVPFLKNRIVPPAIDQKVRAVYALVVLDYGLSSLQTQQVNKSLPAYTTLLLSPYARDRKKASADAEKQKMELWGHIESKNNSQGYTGPLNITHALPQEVRQERINRLLDSGDALTGFVLNNPDFEISSPFTQKGYGYYNLADPTIPTLFYKRYDWVLNDKTRLKTFLNQVFERSNGIIVIEPSPRLIEAIPDLLESFAKAGMQIVPLSYFVDNQ